MNDNPFALALARQQDGQQALPPLKPPAPQSNTASVPLMARTAASMAGVPADIGINLVRAESGFDPRAHNPSGASGLTQLMPDTARALGVSDVYNPQENLAGGMKYLAEQYKRFGSWPYALAAYNWGPGNVQAWLRRGGHFNELPRETQDYLHKILNHADYLRASSLRQLTSDVANPFQQHNNPFERYADNPFKTHAHPSPSPAPGAPPSPTASPSASPTPTATPQAAPTPQTLDSHAGAQAGFTMPGSGFIPRVAHGLDVIAGHQDGLFILMNAQARDAASGKDKGILALLRDPSSQTYRAFHLWLSDPVSAMDHYGLGAPEQLQFEASNPHLPGWERSAANYLVSHRWADAAATFTGELANPLSWVEGGVVGGALGRTNDAVRAVTKFAKAGHEGQGIDLGKWLQTIGSPYKHIAARGGNEATAWMNSVIANSAAPHILLHMKSTPEMMARVFGGMNPEQQKTIVRLLDKDSSFFKKVEQSAAYKAYAAGKKVTQAMRDQLNALVPDALQTTAGYSNLDPSLGGEEAANMALRATQLHNDIDHVTNERLRAGTLKKSQVRQKYFGMYGAYEFDPSYNVSELFGGTSKAGTSRPARQKTFETLTEALDPNRTDGPPVKSDFLAAEHFGNYREAALREVALQDALTRAPASMHLTGKGLAARIKAGGGKVNGESYLLPAKGTHQARLPALRSGAWAPEFIEFLGKNKMLNKYLAPGSSLRMGESEGKGLDRFAQKFIAFSRGMMLANFGYHPILNVSGNDALQRSLSGMFGPRSWEAGGYLHNSMLAFMHEVGSLLPKGAQRGPLDYHTMVGTAQEYMTWLDKAMRAGAIDSFPPSMRTVFGGTRAALTAADKRNWTARLDKALTTFWDFNQSHTFEGPGEESFAVSLFKDLTTKAHMNDGDAAVLVRQALGDYYNFDPTNPLRYIDLFMPWRVGNWRLWTKALTRNAQYATGTTHAITNANIIDNPKLADGKNPYPPNPYALQDVIAGRPITIPSVGRGISDVADAAGSLAQHNPSGSLDALFKMATQTANPIASVALKGINTVGATFDTHDVAGPETSYTLLFNPKLPPQMQMEQLTQSLIASIPFPLAPVGADAVRRGIQKGDVQAAIIEALGGGYTGDPPLSPRQQRQEGLAKKQFLKAWEQYNYHKTRQSFLRWERASSTYLQTMQRIRGARYGGR